MGDEWIKFNARLVILALDPENPLGLEVLQELLDRVLTFLNEMERLIGDYSGSALNCASHDAAAEQQEALRGLLARRQVLREALTHVDMTVGRNVIGDLSVRWAEKTVALDLFEAQLANLVQRKKTFDLQLGSAMSSGDWSALEPALRGVPEPFLNHMTARWMRDQLHIRKVEREELEVVVANLKDLLTRHYSADAVPWRGKADAHGDVAKSPVQVRSMLENAFVRLGELQRRDPDDKYGLQNGLRWRDFNAHIDAINGDQIASSLSELLLEVALARQWLAWALAEVPCDTEGVSAKAIPSPKPHRVVDWQEAKVAIDRMRQIAEFDDAIKACQWVTDGVSNWPHHSAINLPGDDFVSLQESVTHLLEFTLPAGVIERTGLTGMIRNAAVKCREEVMSRQRQGRKGVIRLREWKEDYENRQVSLDAAFNMYILARRASDRFFIGRMYRDKANDARVVAVSAFRWCERRCPEDPKLANYRPYLEVPDIDIVESLWEGL